ncbi:MAG: proton-translocating NADH-ubiquinone oxidoreductase, chain L, partial [uncultured bacterium]
MNSILSLNTLIWLIPLPPLVAFVLILLLTRKSNRTSHWTAILAAGLSFVGSMLVFIKAITVTSLAKAPFGSEINWLPTGDTWLKIGVMVDPLTAVMLFFVAWT